MAQNDSKSTTGPNKGFDQGKKPSYSQNQSSDKKQMPEKPERWSEDSDDIESDDDDARGPTSGSRKY